MSLPMSIEEFNQNFTVKVIIYTNDNNSEYKDIGFKVCCKSNGRISIHTATVNITQLPQNYINEDVVAAGWELVKATVFDWASFNIQEDRLSVLDIVSTSDIIDVNTFNSYFEVQVMKFECTPVVNPTDWCIGFKIVLKSNELTNLYIDGTVSLSQHCNNTLCTNIATAVWDQVKDQVCMWASDKIPDSDVLNKKYIPSSF
jgi:hypothetical protein